jgi:hypothetical protein
MTIPADIQAVIDATAESIFSSPPLLIEVIRYTMKQYFGYSTNTGRRGENEVMDKYYDPFITRTGLWLIAHGRCGLVDHGSWGSMPDNQDYRNACPPRDKPVAEAMAEWDTIPMLKHADERIREWEEENGTGAGLTNGVGSSLTNGH